MGVAISSLHIVVICPRRVRVPRQRRLLSIWKRVALKIILRKKACKIYSDTSKWLKATKGQCALAAPTRPTVAKSWSRLGGLLNNHPKVEGAPTAAEIQISVSRCARNLGTVSRLLHSIRHGDEDFQSLRTFYLH